MTICGIICELNPFHNGHEHIFREARRITGADYVIAVMSGDFVQRGLPAICDKYTRTRMALDGGADLVIELPVIYSTASADYFAQGAVSALDSLRCVDFLCFGSETGNIDYIKNQVKTRIEYDCEAHILTSGTRGNSYAKNYAEITGNKISSNDLLGISYIKSLYMLESQMQPISIKRKGSAYLSDDNEADSATAIRKQILNGEAINSKVPSYVLYALNNAKKNDFPIELNDFGQQLYTRINTILNNEKRGTDKLVNYMDVSANIEGRIKANINDFTTYSAFVNLVHSKEYTKSRVMRALIHILLDIRKEDYKEQLIDECTPYIRIVGFKKASSDVLSVIKDSSIVPVISKASDAARYLDDEASRVFEADINAANIYEQSCAFKYLRPPMHDFSKGIVIAK